MFTYLWEGEWSSFDPTMPHILFLLKCCFWKIELIKNMNSPLFHQYGLGGKLLRSGIAIHCVPPGSLSLRCFGETSGQARWCALAHQKGVNSVFPSSTWDSPKNGAAIWMRTLESGPKPENGAFPIHASITFCSCSLRQLAGERIY